MKQKRKAYSDKSDKVVKTNSTDKFMKNCNCTCECCQTGCCKGKTKCCDHCKCCK